jgi:hypothetical protein
MSTTNRYMGTEETIFSLLFYRFPELVHHYDNGDAGNCAMFQHAAGMFDRPRQ